MRSEKTRLIDSAPIRESRQDRTHAAYQLWVAVSASIPSATAVDARGLAVTNRDMHTL